MKHFARAPLSSAKRTRLLIFTILCLTIDVLVGNIPALVISVPAPVSSTYSQVVSLGMFKKESLAPSLNELSSVIAGENDDHSVTAVSASVDVSASRISIHSSKPSDEPFLYRTYASTRSEEMALTGWSTEQQEIFLRLQYEAQRRSYRLQFPDAQYSVIRRNELPAGRLIIDRTAQETHIVDIALLPEFRRLGIGSIVMMAIMREASQNSKTVRLHVECFNPALHWYGRLGFGVVSPGPIYLEMLWRPLQASAFGGVSQLNRMGV